MLFAHVGTETEIEILTPEEYRRALTDLRWRRDAINRAIHGLQDAVESGALVTSGHSPELAGIYQAAEPVREWLAHASIAKGTQIGRKVQALLDAIDATRTRTSAAGIAPAEPA